jgi:hypothetical protein
MVIINEFNLVAMYLIRQSVQKQKHVRRKHIQHKQV